MERKTGKVIEMASKDWEKKSQVAYDFRIMKSLGLAKPTKKGKRTQYLRMLDKYMK